MYSNSELVYLNGVVELPNFKMWCSIPSKTPSALYSKIIIYIKDVAENVSPRIDIFIRNI